MATTALNFEPIEVSLEGYAGDTLTLLITVSDPLYTEGCTWTGHIKATRQVLEIDETWNIIPDAQGGATIELTAEQTTALAASGVLFEQKRTTASPRTKVRRYSGEFDIQVSRPGFTKTLVQGTLILNGDVTQVAVP